MICLRYEKHCIESVKREQELIYIYTYHKKSNGKNNQLYGHKLYSAITLFLGDGWQGRAEGLEISDKLIGELLIKEQEFLLNSAFNNYL